MSAAPAPVRVSVCIPARDHAEHLGAAIRSALAQDVEGLEVVVTDDGSRDATPAVVRDIADDRVRYLRHGRPLGVAAARASCLRAARGTYVAWLDADDERLPGSLAPQLAVLDAHPEVVLIHGGHTIVDVDGCERESVRRAGDGSALQIEPAATAFGQLLASNEIATSTAVTRRSAHEAAGPVAEQASSSDWEMWLRLARRGAVAYLPRLAARYRRHPRSISHATLADGERLRCDVRVVERVLSDDASSGAVEPVAGTAGAALAAKALLHAGEAYTGARIPQALDAISLAARLWPATPERGLRDAAHRGDDVTWRTLTRATLRRLADQLAHTRFGAKVAAAVADRDGWEDVLVRAGATVDRVVPADAVVAAIAKWDPALLAACGRPGVNCPDRTLAPDGYPADGAAAVAHVRELRSARDVTHLVVPGVSDWWLEHYVELRDWLGTPLWCDDDCRIFDVRELS